MDEKLMKYLNGIFSPYEEVSAVRELKKELFNNLQEKLSDLKNMWKIIKDLARSRITVFLTTQYLDEADQPADQITILNKGKIVAEGTGAKLKKLLPKGHKGSLLWYLKIWFPDKYCLISGQNL